MRQALSDGEFELMLRRVSAARVGLLGTAQTGAVDAIPPIDQDGVGKAKFCDRGELLDLFVRMRPGVSRVRDEALDEALHNRPGDKR